MGANFFISVLLGTSVIDAIIAFINVLSFQCSNKFFSFINILGVFV